MKLYDFILKVRTKFFDCHLSTNWRQMAIKTLSLAIFDPLLSIVTSVFDRRLSGMLMKTNSQTKHMMMVLKRTIQMIHFTRQKHVLKLLFFVWFDSLRPSQQLWSCRHGQFTKSHIFLDKLDQAVNQYFVHILLLETDNNPSWVSGGEENSRRNYFMINLHESMDQAGIELATPKFAVRRVSAARDVPDCATQSGIY